MTQTGFPSWSHTASSNSNADSTVNWAEGQAPSSINDSARAMMAALAKYRDDVSGSLTTGGTSTAFTIATNQVFASLADLDGKTITIVPHATSGASPTLAVDSLTAKGIKTATGVAVPTGALVEGSPYRLTYFNTAGEFILHDVQARSVIQPPGLVFPYAGSTSPDGFLLCYGQAVSRTTYADLFGVISTTFGTGDGSTTFALPDIRGRVVAGQDDMGGTSADRLTGVTNSVNGDTLGGTGGQETHTLTATESAALTYTSAVTDPGHAHVYQGWAFGGVAADGGSVSFQADTTNSAVTGITVATTSNAGGGAHNNVQPTIILNYIIKF